MVPGAVRLTAEAALRAGAGKVRIATIAGAALPLGLALPEAAVLALPEQDGQIMPYLPDDTLKAAKGSDATVFGPGMNETEPAAALLPLIAGASPHDGTLLLDAAAVACAGDHAACLAGHGGRLVLTPHEGEMACLAKLDADTIRHDPVGVATDTAARLSAAVALKGVETIIAAPDGTVLHYAGGGPGLATGGSGDVLAGVIGGLLARGADPLVATAWGVWLHGEAGKTLARDMAPIGFLARELLTPIPTLMRRAVNDADLGPQT